MIFRHYQELLQTYRWQVMAIMAFSVLAFGGTGAYQVRTSPEYTTAANVLLIPSRAELEFGLGGRNTPSNVQNLTETYMEYVTSRPVIETALAKIDERIGLVIEEETASSPVVEYAKSVLSGFRRALTEFDKGMYVEVPANELRILKVQDAISVSNVASTHIMRIQVTWEDPEYAALIANTLAEAYVERISAENNDNANDLEAYLQAQIEEKETMIADLRAEQTRLDERYGIGNEFVGNIESQLRVEEAKLVELHSQLLTMSLSRASATSTQARLVEPAIAPAYASSPGIISMSLIGLIVGFMLAGGFVVVRDIFSGTITTSADLQRVAGSRAIGLMPRPKLFLFAKRSLKRFGLAIQQHFALARLASDPAQKRLTYQLKLPAPDRTAQELAFAGEDEELGPEHEDFLEKIYREARIRTEIEEGSDFVPAGNYCFARITGLASMDTLCRATIHIAAGMASIGNNVYCKLPEDTIRRPPRLSFGKTGQVFYELPTGESADHSDYITIECAGPLNAKFSVDGFPDASDYGPLICVLPQGEIPETVVEAMREKVAAEQERDWHFLLMSAPNQV